MSTIADDCTVDFSDATLTNTHHPPTSQIDDDLIEIPDPDTPIPIRRRNIMPPRKKTAAVRKPAGD